MTDRRIKQRLCALIVVALLASGTQLNRNVYADNSLISGMEVLEQAVVLYENLQNGEIEIPVDLADTGLDESFLKAVIMGYANMEDADEFSGLSEISKQDFMEILYKTIINYDPTYAISEEETNAILNECYDNAYIRDENRTSYAFMLKQGIITTNHGTNPNKPVTRESSEILINLVREYFMQNVTITVGKNEITIGSNVDNLLAEMGEPNRIDESEYGFDWYVYNSNYSEFCMIGVEGSRVCAVFTNCGDFSYETLTSGCDFQMTADYEGLGNFKFFSDTAGRLDAIMYNPREKGLDRSAELQQAKSSELLDFINANRSKNARTIYVEDSNLSSEAWLSSMDGSETEQNTVTLKSGYDVYSVYKQLLTSDSEVLTADSGFVSSIGLDAAVDESGVQMSLVTADSAAPIPETAGKIEFEETGYSLNEVETVTTPILVSPATGDIYNGGDDIVIELAEQASTEYHIEVFDVESDEYAVNEYIKTDETRINLPAELFTEGCDYTVIVSSVTSDGTVLSAEEVNISYGSAFSTGVRIKTPEIDTVTDDDYMKITWESDVYSDFSVELYNENDELLASTVLEGENEALIQGIDPGKYSVFVTALRKGTAVEKARDAVTFEIEAAIPVINEIILEPEDKYYFVYEDEALGVLYLYDEELVDVDGVTKKKIIQKQVKATKGYRQLAKRQQHMEFTTGAPVLTRRMFTTEYSSETGMAIVAEAEKYLGVDYVWGGTSPSGFDCSGLVQYCLNSLGISIDRVAEDQFNAGMPVSRDELQPGDLVFFEQNGYIHHVGIYVGNNMMIHAPHTGEVVKYQSLDDEYYKREYAGARRVY